MLKKLSMFLVLTTAVFIFSSCSNLFNANEKSNNGKLKVVVSFNAMRELAEAVGKDKVDVHTIIPNGTEPHDFEPKAKDLESLGSAKVFVYNGLEMEAWADKAVKSVDNQKLVVVNASKGSTPLGNSEGGEESSKYDPHLWISLKGAEAEAKNIKNAFQKVSPNNKGYFEKNYNEFCDKLDKLFTEYNDKFSKLSNKNFVTGHAAFGYLCRDFGLKQNSVQDVFADGEPSAKKLKELVDYCKKNGIKTIFVEDMVSPKVSETLAREVGAKAEKIYTIESKEDSKDYIQSMNYNLEKIYDSMKIN